MPIAHAKLRALLAGAVTFGTSRAGELWLYVLGVVVIATVVPYLFSVAAVRLIPAARVGLASTSEPVIAAVAAWLLIGQSLDALQVVGGLIVVAGILVAQSVRLSAEGV